MPKQPQAAFESVFAFSPNRATLGGTSYLILGNRAGGVEAIPSPIPNPQPNGGGPWSDRPPETGDPQGNDRDRNDSPFSQHCVQDGLPQDDDLPQINGLADNCLIDCPPWDEGMEALLRERGGIGWLIITNRDGIATLKTVREIQNAFKCQVVIQEQEAYLLPGLELKTFHRELAIAPDLQVIWTPGYSPGSSCVYLNRYGGTLFSGRHLLPTPDGNLRPQRHPKTFHWTRQLKHVEALRSRFTAHTLQHCCPGANIGILKKSLKNPDTQGDKKGGNAIYHIAHAQLVQSLEALNPLDSGSLETTV